MPEIPRDIDAQVVEQPKLDPSRASMGSAAIASFGGKLEQSAFYGAHVEGMLQSAQDRVDASHLEAKYRDMYEQKAEGLDQVPYRDAMKYAQTSIEEIQKESQNDPILKNNPRLQNLFSPYLENYARSFQHATHLRYVKELQQDGYTQYDNEMSRYEQDASKLPAGPGREAIFKEMEVKSQDFVKSYLLNPATVNTRLQSREKNVQEGWILNLTRSQNPMDIQHGIDVLNAKDDENTNKIDPEKKAIYLGQAEQHLEAVQNKISKDTALQTANGLLTKNHNDAELALAELNSNQELQKGLGEPTYKETRQLLRDHIEDTEQEKKRVSGNITKDIMDNIKGAKLGNARKMLDSSKESMTKEDYDIMSNAITSEEKYIRSERREEMRAEREKSREDGDKIFGDLMTKILSGKELDNVKDIYSQAPHGLSASHAKILQDINDGKKDPAFKQAVNVIDDAFKSGIIDAEKKGKLINDLRQKQLDEKLQGDDLIESASKMVKPHVEHWYTGLLDNVVKKLKGESVKTETAPMKSKSGKDIWKWPDGTMHYSPPPEKE